MLTSCNDLQECQRIHYALGELKGLKHSGHEIVTLSFGSGSLKHREATKSRIGKSVCTPSKDNLIDNFKETPISKKNKQEINGKCSTHMVPSTKSVVKDNTKEKTNYRSYFYAGKLGKSNFGIEDNFKSTDTKLDSKIQVLPDSASEHLETGSGIFIARTVNVLKAHNQNNQVSGEKNCNPEKCDFTGNTGENVNKFKKVEIYRAYNKEKPDLCDKNIGTNGSEEPFSKRKENFNNTDNNHNIENSNENSSQGKAEKSSKLHRNYKVKSRPANLNLSSLNKEDGLIDSKNNVISSPGSLLNPSLSNTSHELLTGSPTKQTTPSPQTPGSYSQRKPRKIVSYRSSPFSPKSKLSPVSSTVSRSRLNSASAFSYPSLDLNDETQQIIAGNLKDNNKISKGLKIMKGENPYLEVGSGIILTSLTVNSDVTTKKEKMETDEVLRSLNSENMLEEGILKNSEAKKKAAILRWHRIDSDDKKLYKKNCKKSIERDKTNEADIKIDSVPIDKTENKLDQKLVSTNLSLNSQQLPQNPLKEEINIKDDKAIHAQQEHKCDRYQKLTQDKDSVNNSKMSPADLKRSLEKKLERSDSKKTQIRIRRELQLLSMENKQKLANNLSKSLTDSDDEIPVQSHHMTAKNENLRKFVQRSNSDYIVNRPRTESDTDFLLDVQGGAHDQTGEMDETEYEIIDINLSTPEKINLIGTLMQEEAKLQDLLRKNTNFSNKRQIRAQVRHLRQRRMALEGVRELDKATTSKRSVTTTPRDNQFPIAIKDSGDLVTQQINLTELRRKLDEAQDYDEKKKIRVALRQLRQQNREDGGHPQTGLHKSQSFIQQKSSEPVKPHSTLSNKWNVVRSQSVTNICSGGNSKKELLFLTNGERTSIDRSQLKYQSLENIPAANSKPPILGTSSCKGNVLNVATNYLTPYSTTSAVAEDKKRSKKRDSGVSNDSEKHSSVVDGISSIHSSSANFSVQEHEDKVIVRENILRETDRNTKSTESKLRPSENNNFLVQGLLLFPDKNKSVQKVKDLNCDAPAKGQYSSRELLQDTVDKIETQKSNLVLDRCQLFEGVGKDQTQRNTKHAHVKVTPVQFERKKIDKDSCEWTVKSDGETKAAVKESDNKFLEYKTRLKDSSENLEIEDKHKILTYLSEPDNKLDINNESLTPSLQWLEEKRKSVRTANDVEKVMSIMDIEAAFTQILDAVDKFPDEREQSLELAVDITIMEETAESVKPNDRVDGENVFSDRDTIVKAEDETDNTVKDIKNDMVNLRCKCDTDIEDRNVHQEQNAIPEALGNIDSEVKDQETETLSMDILANTGNKGAISVIHAEDGAVTVQEVCHLREGETTITEWKKLRRTQSKTETRQTDRVIEKTLTSSDGSPTVYERDVSRKTQKLTARGSNYFTHSNYNIKKRSDPDGTDIIQQELNSLSENTSVSKNKSWGDFSEAKVMLNCQPSDGSQGKLEPVVDGNQLETLHDNQNGQRACTSTSIVPSITAEVSSSRNIIQSYNGHSLGCPEITSPLHDVFSIEGSTISLECTVVSSPLSTVTWYKGDNKVTAGGQVKLTFDEGMGKANLEISNVSTDDSGRYRCLIEDAAGTATSHCILSVIEKSERSPSFISHPNDITVQEGHVLDLECQIRDADCVTWYKDGMILRNDVNFKQIFDGSIAKLKLTKVYFEDCGTYTCTLNNENGEKHCSFKITVTESKCHDKVLPVFLKKPESQVADEQDNVFIESEVTGSPKPEITWFCNGSKITGDSRYRMIYDGMAAVLVIRKVTLKDCGKIECHAENSSGRISAECTLIVQATKSPPYITQPLSDITINSGKVAILECGVQGVLPSDVVWRKNGLVIGQMFDFKQMYADGIAQLEISKVCHQDSGSYECVATNENGEARTSGQLMVQDEITIVPTPTMNLHAVPILTTNDKESCTAALKAFPTDFAPKSDIENRPVFKSETPKLMIARQSSLRSNDHKNSGQPLQRSESLQCMVPQKTEKQINFNEDVNSRSELHDVKISNNVRLEDEPSSLVSKIDNHQNYNKEFILETNEIVQSVETKDIETSDNLKKLVDHNENYTADLNVVSDKFLNEWKTKTELEPVTDNDKGICTGFESKTSFLDSGATMDTKLNSLCLETSQGIDLKPVAMFKAGAEIRRTQSVKSYGNAKPEWLQMKLRKVNGNKPSPLAMKAREIKCSPLESKASEVKLSHLASTAMQKIKHDINDAISDNLQIVPNEYSSSVHNETKLSKSPVTKPTMNLQPSSLTLKDSSNSPVNLPNKDSPKTPVSERAKLFQMNETSSTSGKPSPVEIIAKAINLSRTESLRTSSGLRSSNVQRSQSFKTISSGHHAGDITPEMLPTKSLAQDQKRDLSSSGTVVNHWDPAAPSQTRMDYAKIQDEEELSKLLSASDNFDERKKIRARIKEIRDQHTKEWEASRVTRQRESEDLIKKKHHEADLMKQQKLEGFKKQAAEHQELKHLEVAEQYLKEKHKQADEEKKRTLQEFQSRDAVHKDQQHLEVSQRVFQEKIKQADILKQKQLDHYDQQARKEDGKTTTATTIHKVESVTKTSASLGKPAEEIAPELAQQFINATNNVSGILTVKTESWTSKDGITKRSEKTESWGGKASAMNQFKQMDATNNPSLKTNQPSGKVNMTRSPSAIKTMLLEWCKAMTREYVDTIDIQNFSSSWNDGIAFCALIHHFYPEAFDFKSLNPKERRKNFELAFDTAEKYADIAPLLDVEDMVRMQKPDWKCVFTYIQSFYRKLRDHDNNKVKSAE